MGPVHLFLVGLGLGAFGWEGFQKLPQTIFASNCVITPQSNIIAARSISNILRSSLGPKGTKNHFPIPANT